MGVSPINSKLHTGCFTNQQHTTQSVFHQSTAHYTVGISPVNSTLHSGYFTSHQHTTHWVFHQSTTHYTVCVSPVNSTLHSMCFTNQQHTNRLHTINSLSASFLTHLLPVTLTFSLCTLHPGSFVLLQTHGYFVFPMLEQKL